MDSRIGEIVPCSMVEKMPEEEKKYFVKIKRDLTALENNNRQIMLYQPCGCGSGKKFKFCCFKKTV